MFFFAWLEPIIYLVFDKGSSSDLIGLYRNAELYLGSPVPLTPKARVTLALVLLSTYGFKFPNSQEASSCTVNSAELTGSEKRVGQNTACILHLCKSVTSGLSESKRITSCIQKSCHGAPESKRVILELQKCKIVSLGLNKCNKSHLMDPRI